MRTDTSTRLLAARVARSLLNGDIGYEEFHKEYPDEDIDDDIDDLLDLIEHEPQTGGLLGVSKATHASYRARIMTLIGRLEKPGL